METNEATSSAAAAARPKQSGFDAIAALKARVAQQRQTLRRAPVSSTSSSGDEEVKEYEMRATTSTIKTLTTTILIIFKSRQEIIK